MFKKDKVSILKYAILIICIGIPWLYIIFKYEYAIFGIAILFFLIYILKIEKHKTNHIISNWRYIDIKFCLFFMFSSLFFIVTTYCEFYLKVFGTAFLFLLTIRFCRRLYYIDNPIKKPFKIIMVTVRVLLYTVAVALLILPFTMHNDWKWYYPVQRALYTSGFTKDSEIHYILPKTIPNNSEKYEVEFIPSVLQASGGVDLYYYTDSKTIVEYKEKAEKYGAYHYDITDEKVKIWFEEMTDNNIDTDGAEVYVFEYGHYIINENTGYFRFYW